MGSCEASHAGVGLGTNCIEMCPSKRGPQGEGTRGLRRRLAQNPPGGPKVPVAPSVPSRASAGRLRVLSRPLLPAPGVTSTSSASTASSTLSLANTVGGDHQRRSPRLVLVAGGRGLGRRGLAGRPTLDTLSIC